MLRTGQESNASNAESSAIGSIVPPGISSAEDGLLLTLTRSPPPVPGLDVGGFNSLWIDLRIPKIFNMSSSFLGSKCLRV